MPGPTILDVFRARLRLAGTIRRTPLVPAAWLSDAGAVLLKLESAQVTSSFKIRGALNALARLVENGWSRPVVTASAGNHGRAVAAAAESLGLRAIVFTPRDAPRTKRDAIARHGADLRAVADHYEHAEALAIAFAREEHLAFVSPYNHPDVVAGGGTVALEMLEDDPHLETIVVPIGGGGLVSGIAIAARAINPAIRIVGVEAEASQAFTAARRAGRPVMIDVGETIADGLGGNIEPESITWPIVRDLVDEIALVSEQDLRDGIRMLLAEEHLVAEGAGIAAVAAVAAGRLALNGRRTAAVVTGANIDLERLSRLTIAD